MEYRDDVLLMGLLAISLDQTSNDDIWRAGFHEEIDELRYSEVETREALQKLTQI